MNFVPEDGTPDGPIDPIMLKEGLDGSLVYVDFGWGWQESVNPAAIRRVRFITGNLPPVAQVAAQPLAGSPPLGVNFSSSGSFDPEGQPLSYAWDFGDGTGAAEPNPTHTYLESGVFEARLSLGDGELQTFSESLTISVGTPPVGGLTRPQTAPCFAQVTSYSSRARPPTRKTAHCRLPRTRGRSCFITILTYTRHSDRSPVRRAAVSWCLLRVTRSRTRPATRSSSRQLTPRDSSVPLRTYIYPDKVNLTFVSDPAEMSLNIDGVPRSAPFTIDTVAGFQHSIDAPDQSIGTVTYEFVSWSDDGPQSHIIVVGGSTDTYTALFHVTAVGIFPAVSTVTTGTPAGGDESSLLATITSISSSIRHATVPGRRLGTERFQTCRMTFRGCASGTRVTTHETAPRPSASGTGCSALGLHSMSASWVRPRSISRTSRRRHHSATSSAARLEMARSESRSNARRGANFTARGDLLTGL